MKNPLWFHKPEELLSANKMTDVFPIIYLTNEKKPCKVDLINSIMRSIIYLFIFILIFWSNESMRSFLLLAIIGLVITEISFISNYCSHPDNRCLKKEYNNTKENMTSYKPENYQSKYPVTDILDQNRELWKTSAFNKEKNEDRKFTNRIEDMIKNKFCRGRNYQKRNKFNLNYIGGRHYNTENMLNAVRNYNSDPNQIMKDHSEKFYDDQYNRNRLRAAIGNNNLTMDGYRYGAPQETAILNGRIPKMSYMDAMGYYDHNPGRV